VKVPLGHVCFVSNDDGNKQIYECRRKKTNKSPNSKQFL